MMSEADYSVIDRVLRLVDRPLWIVTSAAGPRRPAIPAKRRLKMTADTNSRDSAGRPSDKNAPFRAAIDSTVMLTIARFGMPILISVALGGLGWVITDLKAGQREGLSELKDGQRQVWTQIGKMADTQSTTNNVQSGLVATVSAVKEKVDHLQVQVDSLPRK